MLLRVVALPRWREHAVTAGWLAGLLVQVPVVLESYAQHTQRVTSLARPVRALGFYFHNVALRAFGWRVSLRLVAFAGLNGATVIVCAILVAVFGWALVTGSRQVRVFVAVALIMGFVQTVFAATVVRYVISQPYSSNFEGGSRYSTMPIMAMVQMATCAVLFSVGGTPSFTHLPGPQVWFAIVITGVFASAVAFYIQTWAQAHLDASRLKHLRPANAG